ncbi:glycoside hydrolase family protein [cf. Phormidesmis sp. LEGE 11477]|nr:glycoside hydrolase family protein [cf. Phormidesmis sp. LEGE 11477]
MQTNNLPETKENKSRRLSSLFPSALSKLGAAIIVTGVIIFAAVELRQRGNHSHPQPSPFGDFPTLAMSGGDPYIRALMRTISASESNGNDPYVLLYSGDHTHDLGQHPDICIPIQTEVNQGDCSTAAGRYQFLTSTWQEKAFLYHPNPNYQAKQVIYSFSPEYQDQVTYQWLKDERMWSIDVLDRLRQGDTDEVLKHLSGTWTSLGFGIENNSMTPYLAEIYEQILAEELQQAQSPADHLHY